jgi:multiple sugar transport system substrate-binding protein
MISQGPSICVLNKPDSGEVLASWLFAQYMITNDVQIAYSSTEGYVPVTSKARNSAEYKEYLSRSGEDNSLYYSVKIDAAKLLLDNTSNTFVTPVFNGSTSLRNAAGQLIENTAKSTRRGQTIDDKYIESLYEDTKSLYRLDQLGSNDMNSKEDLGPLPLGSKLLLGSIGTAWVVIVAYFIVQFVKKKRAD